MKRTLSTLTVIGGLFAGCLTAQTHVQANQQKRIAEGIESGQLTARETAKIEKDESKINREVRRDRRANGGNLTNNQKKQVARQRGRVSREIYNQKHDSQTQPR